MKSLCGHGQLNILNKPKVFLLINLHVERHICRELKPECFGCDGYTRCTPAFRNSGLIVELQQAFIFLHPSIPSQCLSEFSLLHLVPLSFIRLCCLYQWSDHTWCGGTHKDVLPLAAAADTSWKSQQFLPAALLFLSSPGCSGAASHHHRQHSHTFFLPVSDVVGPGALCALNENRCSLCFSQVYRYWAELGVVIHVIHVQSLFWCPV